MPDFLPYTVRQLDAVLAAIKGAVYPVVGALDITAWRTPEPVPYSQRTSGEKLTLSVGQSWGSLFDCAWFHFTGSVPASAAGQPAVLLLDVNGEMCIFDQEGVPLRGLTSVTSGYDFSLGEPGKHVFPLTPKASGGERVDVWADAGCNDLFGEYKENGVIREAYVAVCREDLRGLFYDFEVLLDFLRSLPTDSTRYARILRALNDAANTLVPGFTPQTVAAARQPLAEELAKKGGDPDLNITAIGHAHIDLGWLWPIRETHRKGARTFATALANMQLYPDYIFGASQPQLFQWVKEDHPALYEKVKQRIREGRFEVQGAMWVEADTNVTGAESLVRQVLYGKRYFSAEFGVEVRNLWLPDVFGYSGALPQILRKASVDYFMTQKISWNLINHFPLHSFYWQGIDGTAILAHMLPEETYNSPASPRGVVKIEHNYAEKGVSDQSLMLFGIGDGGGGPGEEHLERLDRMHNLAGLSPVRQGRAVDFFETWKKDAARFPRWVGELYLERHTGTLTTEARNKWYNRRMEQSLRELEWSALLSGAEYPAARLEAIWKEMLLYQFHDILPGSSIKRVYDESLARYAVMLDEVETMTRQHQASLAQKVDTRSFTHPAIVFNSLSWPRAEWVQVNGNWLRVTAPAMGYNVVDGSMPAQPQPALVAAQQHLENEHLAVEFAADGSIARILDKQAGRAVLAAGQNANHLAVYRDNGDAWDIPWDYAAQAPAIMQLVSAAARLDGPRAVLTQLYRTGHSELTQEIVLASGSRRLEFNNRLVWRETNSMLRTSFPVAIHATEAACEIQFGHIFRPTHSNTTWDLAKDEVAAHKWVDLSQADYGVALLNDSKYGHKVKDGVLELDLLRSMPYPGHRFYQDADFPPGEFHLAYTDQAEHVFRYALYPHAGNLVAGGVVRQAYEFNHPLRVLETQPHPGSHPPEMSLIQLDVSNVVVEAVKKAEDSPRMVVRMYEIAYSGARATLRLGFTAKAIVECNLVEEEEQEITRNTNYVELEFKPFEIKTIMIEG